MKSLEHGDALVVADSRMQLTMADIHGDHMGCATLQQAVGETAGRRAGVEHSHSCDVDIERIERSIELLTAATDEPRRRALHDHGVAGVDETR